jgi:phosphoglycolate phosphatase-like HAD superfamily hydrolase
MQMPAARLCSADNVCMKHRPLIALDGDGVLLDYLEGYAEAWREAFGNRPAVRDPLGYGPLERWEVPRLDAEGRARFRQHFGTRFWSSVPAIPGAVAASLRLHDAGFELVCVTALDSEFEASGLKNLRALGYPIERVYATPHGGAHRSPKADMLAELRPIAFVDDYLPYLRGVAPEVHTALITRGATGGPNEGPDLSLAKSRHLDLADFTDFWLNGV